MSETIVEAFFELHREEHVHTSAPLTCPICDILVRESLQEFEDFLMPRVLAIVTKHTRFWNSGIRRPEILAGTITNAILNHPLVPKRIDLPMEAYDILKHPYVLQKIKELLNK
jgi:hypothetical protein